MAGNRQFGGLDNSWLHAGGLSLPGLEKAAAESAEWFIPQVDGAIQALTKALSQPENLADLLAERARFNGKID